MSAWAHWTAVRSPAGRDALETMPEDCPVDVLPCSNDEYFPLPPSPSQRAIMDLQSSEIERWRRKFNMSRREFVRTSAAMAIGFWAIDMIRPGIYGNYGGASAVSTGRPDACDLEWAGRKGLETVRNLCDTAVWLDHGQVVVRFHHVADRNHSLQLVTVHHRQVTDAVLGHQRAQAVEVTKLSLLLKVLEGETGQTQASKKVRPCPSLSKSRCRAIAKSASLAHSMRRAPSYGTHTPSPSS